MTMHKTRGSGSTTGLVIDRLIADIDEVEKAPPFKRGGPAARASANIVLALRDLDRRIQQLEISASDQQNDRHGDLPTVRRAGSGSQK